MKEKIVLKSRNGRYTVTELINRLVPAVGDILEEKQVEDLLLEARRKDITVIIRG